MKVATFPALGDPNCKHRSHYECVTCCKMVCARCGVEMAEASLDWKTGYRCPDCAQAHGGKADGA
jgi:DNA-directed RNA polymerase subunit RPC12/RpoP